MFRAFDEVVEFVRVFLEVVEFIAVPYAVVKDVFVAVGANAIGRGGLGIVHFPIVFVENAVAPGDVLLLENGPGGFPLHIIRGW